MPIKDPEKQRAYSALYRSKVENKNRKRELSKNWPSNSSEKTKANQKEYMKQWHVKNKEKNREYSKQWALKNPEKAKAQNARYRNKNKEVARESCTRAFMNNKKTNPVSYAAMKMFHGAKSRVTKKGIIFEITKDWILERLQSGCCEVSGISFNFSTDYIKGRKGFSDPYAPSLDQIKPASGYTKENCRVVVWIYNAAKGAFSDKDVFKLAHALCSKTLPVV